MISRGRRCNGLDEGRALACSLLNSGRGRAGAIHLRRRRVPEAYRNGRDVVWRRSLAPTTSATGGHEAATGRAPCHPSGAQRDTSTGLVHSPVSTPRARSPVVVFFGEVLKWR
jgi:hypothetical protein